MTADVIRLQGLQGFGHHGVLASERVKGQTFGVDLAMSVDTRKAALTDDLASTVDYGAVASEVVAIVEGEPFDLIETLADAVARSVLRRKGVQSVEVTVHKPGAPIEVPFSDVTITIARTEADYV